MGERDPLDDFIKENMDNFTAMHDAYMSEDSETVKKIMLKVVGTGNGYGGRSCICTGIILGFSIARNIRRFRKEVRP